MIVSSAFSKCALHCLPNLPYRSEVCARSELCAAGRVQMHISVHVGINFFSQVLRVIVRLLLPLICDLPLFSLFLYVAITKCCRVRSSG